MDDLTHKSDDELKDIMRASIANSYVPSSIYHRAKQELEFRTQKKPSQTNAKLVKSRGGHKYMLEGGVKHYIPDSETKNALGLEGSKFVQLSDDELSDIPNGENIDSVKSTSTRLVRTENNHDSVFIIFTQPQLHRRHVPNEATLTAMHRRQDQVEVIEKEEMSSISEKEALNPVNKWDPNYIKSKPKSRTQNVHNYYGPVANTGSNVKKVKQKNTWKSAITEHPFITILTVVGSLASIVGLLLYIFKP